MGMIFISYAIEDREDARRLYRELERRGFRPWMDEDLDAGVNWRRSIRRRIKKSSYFIPLISNHYVYDDSGFRMTELRWALDTKINILPARLGPAKLKKLNKLHWIDLFPASAYERGVERLVNMLRLPPRLVHKGLAEKVLYIERHVVTIFTPRDPVEKESLLVGREAESRAIQHQTLRRVKNLMVIGEQGVGKTSLAKAVDRKLANSCYIPLDLKSSFDSIMREVLTYFRLPISNVPLTPTSVARHLGSLPGSMIILDPINRLDSAGRLAIVQLLSQLAAMKSKPALVLVGTARSASELLSEEVNQYVEILVVRPLKAKSADQILRSGFRELAEAKLSPKARKYIISQSWPSSIKLHWYALHSTFALLDRVKAREISKFVVGIDECRMAETEDPPVG